MERDPSIRKIEDARALKALAHPLRWDLLEAATVHGPLTATAAAEIVGESPANCSWHLRQLAKYGFLEEVPDAPGRQRPWRRTSVGIQWDDTNPDPEVEEASRALTSVFIDREVELVTAAMRRTQPDGWEESAIAAKTVVWLTLDELNAFHEEVAALMRRHRDRTTDPSLAPPGSRPVRILTLAAADSRLQHPTTGETDAHS